MNKSEKIHFNLVNTNIKALSDHKLRWVAENNCTINAS